MNIYTQRWISDSGIFYVIFFSIKIIRKSYPIILNVIPIISLTLLIRTLLPAKFFAMTTSGTMMMRPLKERMVIHWENIDKRNKREFFKYIMVDPWRIIEHLKRRTLLLLCFVTLIQSPSCHSTHSRNPTFNFHYLWTEY